MKSVFETATGSSVSIKPECLAIARNTLSQATNSITSMCDEVVLSSQSPLKSAASDRPVSVDPEALKAIKRKFEEDDTNSTSSPAKRNNGEEFDFSTLFKRAGSGKSIQISEKALSAAKQSIGREEMESESRENTDAEVPSTSFSSPLISSLIGAARGGAAAAAGLGSATTPLRSTPQSSLLQGRRRLQQGGNGAFKSPFNSPFRPPIAASAANGGFSSPLVARPTAAAAAAAPATPATATASPLSRMSLASPATSSTTITPVSALNRTSRNFTVRVKVTERSGSLAGYGTDGEGRFCCWLSDAAAAAGPTAPAAAAARLEAEAGGEHATRAAAVLQFGKTYDLHCPRLSIRRAAVDNESGLVLFIDDKITIAEVATPSTRLGPRPRSHLAPLSDVREEGGEIDIAGIVRAVRTPLLGASPSVTPSSVTASASSSMTDVTSSSSPAASQLEVTLVDQRGSMRVMLSHEYARVTLQPGDIVGVYRATAKRENEHSSSLVVHAVRGRTKLLINPETEDVRLLSLARWLTTGAWAAPPGGTKMRSCAAIGERMRAGGETEFATKAMLTSVDAAAEETVDECAGCGRRVSLLPSCECAAAAGVVKRLQLEVEISDGTGLIAARVSGREAEQLVGVTTREAVGMLRWNRDAWRVQCRRIEYESRVIKLVREKRNEPLRIVSILPVPYIAYHTLISKKLDEKVHSQ